MNNIQLPSNQELLAFWESHWDRTLLERMLGLLVLAYPFSDKASASRISIGERNNLLFLLRGKMFGHVLPSTANCIHCQTKVEWENQLGDFPLTNPLSSLEPEMYELVLKDFRIKFRLPNSYDIHMQSTQSHPSPKALLFACVNELNYKEKAVGQEDIPQNVWDALSKKMSVLDPLATISLKLTCPACLKSWTSYFDIMSYLWAELDQWAKDTLQDVYLLARGFGWNEEEILKLSPGKRQIYIQMLGG